MCQLRRNEGTSLDIASKCDDIALTAYTVQSHSSPC
jgi:hypothetical protein